MAGLYQKNRTNGTAESDGKKLEFDLNSKGDMITFTVAREGGMNTEYQKAAEEIFKPYRRQLMHNKIDPVLLEKLLARLYSRTVVKGWENVEDENCQPLPFNQENCYKLLTDLPIVFDAIKEFARDYTNFLLESLQADVGN